MVKNKLSEKTVSIYGIVVHRPISFHQQTENVGYVIMVKYMQIRFPNQ